VLVLAALALTASACYNSTSGDTEIPGIASFKLPVFPQTGSHKVMVFSEMHYQRSFRVQDVPRLLPPLDSVAFFALGGPDGVTEAHMIRPELRYTTLDEYLGLAIPQRVAQSYDPVSAGELYRVNCSVCHGMAMTGDSPMASMMKEKKVGPVPADLMGPLTQDSPEGEIFAYITNGGRQGFAFWVRGQESRSPMPPFQSLLTEDERWALVKYLLSQ
jgi:mono/diheme cytochrome c family protein